MPKFTVEQRALVTEYLRAVLNREGDSALALVTGMAEKGASLVEVFDVLGAAQVEVGALWERGVIAISDEHFATGVTLECISLVSERKRKFRRESVGAAVLAPVEGEFHTVGLKMLSELLRSEGWETSLSDAGSLSASPEGRMDDHHVDLVCLSATMQSSVDKVAEIARTLRRKPQFASARIVVGGPALTDPGARKAVIDAAGPLVDYLALSLSDALEYSRSITS